MLGVRGLQGVGMRVGEVKGVKNIAFPSPDVLKYKKNLKKTKTTFFKRMIQSLHFTNASTDQVRQALLIDFNLLTLKQWLRTHFLP